MMAAGEPGAGLAVRDDPTVVALVNRTARGDPDVHWAKDEKHA